MGYESAWAPFTRACADFMAENECPQCGMENDPDEIRGRVLRYRCAACGSVYSLNAEDFQA
jgi:transposase-like protein